MEVPTNPRFIPIAAPKLNRSNERGQTKRNTLFLQVGGKGGGYFELAKKKKPKTKLLTYFKLQYGIKSRLWRMVYKTSVDITKSRL
jgi:hypothetical protein